MAHTQFDNGRTKYEQYMTVFLEVLDSKSTFNKTRMSLHFALLDYVQHINISYHWPHYLLYNVHCTYQSENTT